MKLKELKEYLNNLSSDLDDCEVICQKDSEGNGYSPLYCVDENSIYVEETSWAGEAYHFRSTAEDNCMEDDEWEDLKKQKSLRAIILCPIN